MVPQEVAKHRIQLQRRAGAASLGARLAALFHAGQAPMSPLAMTLASRTGRPVAPPNEADHANMDLTRRRSLAKWLLRVVSRVGRPGETKHFEGCAWSRRRGVLAFLLDREGTQEHETLIW